MNWLEFRALKRSDDRAHHVANIILRQFDILEPPIDIEKIINKLEIKLIFLKNPGWDAAADATMHPGHIWINSENNTNRQRFAMAHELGHIILHEPKVWRDADFNHKNINEEKDANDFAAALLVPLWMLEPLVISNRWPTDKFCNVFNVNPGVIAMQLEKLI